MPSRARLAIEATRRLSKEAACEVMREGVGVLRQLAISEPLVIQSDAGSDFTAGMFQNFCQSVGCWVRSKVNQEGGMGVLERLNRTFKHAWLFRHEFSTLLEVQTLADGFRCWYNRERRHSTLAYATPWSVLAVDGKVELVPS